jgi:AraC-like DNA-binding protein
MIGSEPVEWIITVYLQKFGIRTLKGFESKKFRQDCRSIVAADLIRLWSFPEDFRAFRKYVSTRIRRFVLDERSTLNVNADREMDSSSYKPGRKLEFENNLGSIPSTISEDAAQALSPGEENRPIRDAAIDLECSERYVYRLIHLHSLGVHDDHGRMVMPTNEFEKLRQILEERRQRRAEVMLQRRRGKSHDAARKSVYRLHKSSQV